MKKKSFLSLYYKISLFLICFTFSSNAFSGLVGDNFWVGGLIGTQTFKIGGSVTPPLNFGATAGVKLGSFGLGVFYLTGTRTTTLDPLTLDTKLSAIGGQFDFFLLGKIFYLGPRVASFTQTSTFSGITAIHRAIDSSASAILYGAGGGVNIPIGLIVTVGGDINYLVGSVSGAGSSLMSIIGNVKLWF